jgi:hypothetical protein
MSNTVYEQYAYGREKVACPFEVQYLTLELHFCNYCAPLPNPRATTALNAPKIAGSVSY